MFFLLCQRVWGLGGEPNNNKNNDKNTKIQHNDKNKHNKPLSYGHVFLTCLRAKIFKVCGTYVYYSK